MRTNVKTTLGVSAMSAIALLLTGCAGLAGPGMKITGMATSADAEKTAFVDKSFDLTKAHASWAAFEKFGTVYFVPPKPKVDLEVLKKVKKIAIVGFDQSIWARAKKRGDTGSVLGNVIALGQVLTEWGINLGMKPEQMQPLANKAYDDLKAALEKEGFEVVPADRVTTQAAYQAMKYEEAAGSASGHRNEWYQAKLSAYGYKSLPLVSMTSTLAIIGTPQGLKKKVLDNVKPMADVGKAVGADAVLVVNTNVFMQNMPWLHHPSFFNRRYLVNFSDIPGFFTKNSKVDAGGIEADLFAVEPFKEIWSAKLNTEVNVPTDVNRSISMSEWFWNVPKYELDKLGPDIQKVYPDVIAMLAFKLRKDQGR
ncbi:MAG: hypothetical protein NTX64_17570 [Elusimicrobia bacterium]|nr:hypothetical protein [Elusimicrobiota bacterium]